MVQPPHQFRVEREMTSAGVAILSVHGDVDILSAPAFKHALLETIGDGSRQVIVDLTAVPFIDSTGLGVLVSGAKKARRDGIAIVCDDTATRSMFEIVGFDRLFAVHTSLGEALTALPPGDWSG
jgi:anti-sigma B factor antagonist